MSLRASLSLTATFAVAACVTEQGPLTNRMDNAATGYLSRAARQPVRWQPWGPEAFALAARLDRPVLLVVGIDDCRLCDEMDRAWDDPSLASLVNALFVPVRVDRDERPDVARRYQSVVRTLAGLEGYPLTVFLTADGSAFFGGTTFPVDDPVTGRGLRQILPEAAREYRERRDAVQRQAATAQELAAGRGVATHGLVERSTVEAGVAGVRGALDEARAPGLHGRAALARGAELLLGWFAETGDSGDLRLARSTLELLTAAPGANDGERDALVRAALLRALLRGWVVTGDSGLRRRTGDVLAALRQDLPPGGNEPVFTDGGAFMIGAALDAGVAVGDSAASHDARSALDSLLRRVYASDLGARHATVGSVRGLLQDQVQLAGACTAAFNATGDERYLAIARELAFLIDRDYGDPLGGYFDTAAPDPAAPALAIRTRQVLDDALPGANAWASRVLAELAAATGDQTYRRRAHATLEAFAGIAADGGLWAAAYFDAARAAVMNRER
jgi:uncharacterized protein YyaL (SSP411 family)